jgi:hypothetical protein
MLTNESMLLYVHKTHITGLKKFKPSYSLVMQYFVNPDEVVAQDNYMKLNNPRGVHFRQEGPREHVYFQSDKYCELYSRTWSTYSWHF